MIADTIIREGEATPEDIVLYVPPDASLASPRDEQETTIYLWANEIQAQAGADATDIVVTRVLPGVGAPTGTYPVEDDVRDGVDYGPTGADFDGDLQLPIESDVKLGVGYGADGIEFTGAYSGGGGGACRVIGSPVIRRIPR